MRPWPVTSIREVCHPCVLSSCISSRHRHPPLRPRVAPASARGVAGRHAVSRRVRARRVRHRGPRQHQGRPHAPDAQRRAQRPAQPRPPRRRRLEPNTGDGAGIRSRCRTASSGRRPSAAAVFCPTEGLRGAMLFLPREQADYELARETFEQGCASCGLPVLFWREVPWTPMTWARPHGPVSPGYGRRSCSGPTTWSRAGLRARPVCVPAHHRAQGGGAGAARARRVLRLLDERAHHRVQGHAPRKPAAHVLSRPQRRGDRDGHRPGALALLHQHHPLLERAHPNRYIIHNGRVNTLRGNVIG